MSEMARVIRGAGNLADELMKRVVTIKQAAHQTIGCPPTLMNKIINAETQLDEILWQFKGTTTKSQQRGKQAGSAVY
jgi:hypothetical protein